MKSQMITTMPDGSKWAVPVSVIAESRADHYKSEFEGDLQRSLKEDTEPLFTEDEYEIQDWAANNMNWSDVAEHATQVSPPMIDFNEGWANGYKTFA
jgi:hypothetical protein